MALAETVTAAPEATTVFQRIRFHFRSRQILNFRFDRNQVFFSSEFLVWVDEPCSPAALQLRSTLCSDSWHRRRHLLSRRLKKRSRSRCRGWTRGIWGQVDSVTRSLSGSLKGGRLQATVNNNKTRACDLFFCTVHIKCDEALPLYEETRRWRKSLWFR